MFICVEATYQKGSDIDSEGLFKNVVDFSALNRGTAKMSVVLSIDLSEHTDWGHAMKAATDIAAQQITEGHDDMTIIDAVPIAFNVLPEFP